MGIFSKKNLGGVIGGIVGGPIGFLAGHGYDQKRAQDAARAGFDPYSGMPVNPNYIGMEPGQFSSPATDAYTREAMRQGPSREAQLAMAEQRRQVGLSRDQLKNQALGEGAQAKNALAMKGGLMSGAGERVNTAMGSRALELAQQARSDSAKNIAGIGMEDENNRKQMLFGAAGLGEKAVDRRQLENTKINAFNADKYKNQMSAWAGGKQAEVTANAGKK